MNANPNSKKSQFSNIEDELESERDEQRSQYKKRRERNKKMLQKKQYRGIMANRMADEEEGGEFTTWSAGEAW